MKKFWLDVILLALFIAELSFHYLPKILHEILGVAMLAAIVVHVAINFRRFKALFSHVTPRKFFAIEVDAALIIAVLIISFTGVCMSNHLFPDAVSSELRRNMTLHNLHTATPYIMMILIGAHVGLHAQELRQRFSIGEKIFRAAVVTLAAIGLGGLFLNRFLSRILMKHIFATPATDLPAPLFAILILGGVIFFALITFLADKKFFRHQKLFGGSS